MTYFGAAEDFADSVESKMATRNSRPVFPQERSTWNTVRNVPRGTLRHFLLPGKRVLSQVLGERRPG